METRYAHLRRFAKKLKKGEVIGHVGSSGRATGPNLHFEVLTNKKHVDPLKINVPRSPALDMAAHKRFAQTKAF